MRPEQLDEAAEASAELEKGLVHARLPPQQSKASRQIMSLAPRVASLHGSSPAVKKRFAIPSFLLASRPSSQLGFDDGLPSVPCGPRHFSRTRVNFGAQGSQSMRDFDSSHVCTFKDSFVTRAPQDPDTRPLFLRKACALMCRRLLRLSSCSVVFGKVQKVQKMPQPHTSAQPSCVLCRRHVGAFEELRVSE